MRRSTLATALAIVSFGTGAACRAAGAGQSGSRAVQSSPPHSPLILELGPEESEVVDVVSTGKGHRAFVAGPVNSCFEPDGASFLAIVDFPTCDPAAARELNVINLGPGEATSVAGVPTGTCALVCVKAAGAPGTRPGSLLVVDGDRVRERVPTGPGPDSVAISPDGRFAIVACEAEAPDDDCSGETFAIDAAGSIQIFELSDRGQSPGKPRLAAQVSAEALSEALNRLDSSRSVTARDMEPEFVAVSHDSSLALVTLQEQNAVAVLDLKPLRVAPAGGASTDLETAGSDCLAAIVLLANDFRDRGGELRGAHPDGVAISPDGSFAITANEAHPKGRHLQGISILDLRGGPYRVKLAGTHSIFDLDPALRVAPGKKAIVLGNKRRPIHKPKRLPRLDPEGIAIAKRGEMMTAALAIERCRPGEESGSVLLLDVTGALQGVCPRRLDRQQVGANPGARPETLDFSSDGRFLVVASERDGGTLTVLDLDESPRDAR